MTVAGCPGPLQGGGTELGVVDEGDLVYVERRRGKWCRENGDTQRLRGGCRRVTWMTRAHPQDLAQTPPPLRGPP